MPQLWTHQRELVRGNLAQLTPEKWHQLKAETAVQLKGTPMARNGTGWDRMRDGERNCNPRAGPEPEASARSLNTIEYGDGDDTKDHIIEYH